MIVSHPLKDQQGFADHFCRIFPEILEEFSDFGSLKTYQIITPYWMQIVNEWSLLGCFLVGFCPHNENSKKSPE